MWVEAVSAHVLLRFHPSWTEFDLAQAIESECDLKAGERSTAS